MDIRIEIYDDGELEEEVKLMHYHPLSILDGVVETYLADNKEVLIEIIDED